MKIIVNCVECNIETPKYTSNTKPTPKNYFCSRSCKHAFNRGKTLEELHGIDKSNELISKLKSQTGENNPNYGNIWNDAQRKNLSEYKVKQYQDNPDMRVKAGDSNRGVKFSKERIEKMHSNRTRESYIRIHSKETKRLIGNKSKEKFTKSYKENHRKIMEEKRLWTPRADKELLELYTIKADWINSMYSFVYVDNSIDKKVRDHIIPRWVGLKFKVYPNIINHPLNCKIIEHADNVSKGFKDRKMSDEYWQIMIHGLIYYILDYDNFWFNKEAVNANCRSYLNNEYYNLGELYEYE